ncbi:MAG: branched-chain amino acid ABC transporter substrate-binding protein [Alphaproteobacteria bacterium]|nr:branched-chain amino acid ABC transporter substrate-binding protein [Alphaproteobacteria bacterium]
MESRMFVKNAQRVIALLFFSLAFPFYALAADPETISIGLAGPMSGQRAVFGEQMRQAAELSVDKINASGGFLGKKITLEVGDDANEASQAVSIASRFVSKGIKHVVGHWGAGMTLPASDVYADANVLMITPASILSEITEKGHSLVFRTVGTDKQIAEKMSEYVKKSYTPKDKILLIGDQGAPAARSVMKFFGASLASASFNNKAEEYYAEGTKDFSALMTKAKDIHPTVIACFCYHVEAALIMRAARSAGITSPFVGWDVFSAPELWQIAGATGEGTVFVSDPVFAYSPAAKDFIKALEDKKITPQVYHFYTYASFQVLQQAITKAQSLDPKKIADVIHAGTFDTVIGKISYAPNGDLKAAQYETFIRKNNAIVKLEAK